MKPTLKQVQFLTSRGITMPRSKTLAFKLISFLKHGYHPDSLTDESSRIAFVKSTQAKWLDQRIMHSCGPGQVISISARTIEEHSTAVGGEDAEQWKMGRRTPPGVEEQGQGPTGLAALDLNSQSTNESDDAYAIIKGQVFQNPHVDEAGVLVIDRGLGAQVAPPPPSEPITSELPPQSETTTVVYPGLVPGTPAYALLRSTTVPYRAGTAVCNVK